MSTVPPTGPPSRPSSGAPDDQSGSWATPQPQTGSFGTSSPPTTGAVPLSAATGATPTTGAHGTQQVGTAPGDSAGHAQPVPPWASGPPHQPRTGRRGGRTWLVVAAAVVAIALAATLFFVLRPGGAVQTSKGEVANAEAFLESARKQWRGSLPSDGLRIGKNAQCYYEIDPDRDEVTGVIACGPVRRFGSGEGQVWDLFTFSSDSRNSDGDPIATNLFPSETGKGRPPGELRDANGDGPAEDADKVAEPDLPKADPDLLMTSVSPGSVTVTDVVKPGEKGKVITPDGTLIVESLGVAESISPDGEPPQQAADGHKLLVLSTNWENQSGYSDLDTTALLSVAGKQTDITDALIDAYGSDETTLLVSVPDDEASSLSISYAGHDQIVDLATGERQPDPVTDVFYRPVTYQDVVKSASFGPTAYYTSDSGSAQEGTYKIEIDWATLTPFVATEAGGQGWAPEGSAWLFIGFNDSVSGGCCTYTSDSDKTGYGGWLVTVDGAAPVPATVVDSDKGYAVFAVPSSAQNIQLNLTTHAVFTSYDNKPDLSLDFGPATFDVAFPA